MKTVTKWPTPSWLFHFQVFIISSQNTFAAPDETILVVKFASMVYLAVALKKKITIKVEMSTFTMLVNTFRESLNGWQWVHPPLPLWALKIFKCTILHLKISQSESITLFLIDQWETLFDEQVSTWTSPKWQRQKIFRVTAHRWCTQTVKWAGENRVCFSWIGRSFREQEWCLCLSRPPGCQSLE